LGHHGLQHQDGNSQVIASMVPNCRAYDPAYACELAVIVDHGIRRMLDEQRDEFFYITVMNENYSQPSLPEGVEQDVIRGMYRLRREEPASPRASLRLLGSGAILCEVIAAAELLAKNWNIASEIFSVTSFSELAREAREIERWNRLHPSEAARQSHVEALLAGNTPGRRSDRLRTRVSATHCLVHARSLRRAGHGTVSDAATPVPHCRGSSKSTATTSRLRRWMRWHGTELSEAMW
jgi:pyruvate dehydrogenase E1 component